MAEREPQGPFDDPKISSELLKDVEAFYHEGFSKVKKLRRFLSAQFLSETVFDASFSLSQDVERLAEKIFIFLPNWKKTYFWQEPLMADERIRVVRLLTYQDIADLSQNWSELSRKKLLDLPFNDPNYKKVEYDFRVWTFVKSAANRAVELEKGGKK